MLTAAGETWGWRISTGWRMVTNSWGCDGCVFVLSLAILDTTVETASERNHSHGSSNNNWLDSVLAESTHFHVHTQTQDQDQEDEKNVLERLTCCSLFLGLLVRFPPAKSHWAAADSEDWGWWPLWVSTHHCRNESNSWGLSWLLLAALV